MVLEAEVARVLEEGVVQEDDDQARHHRVEVAAVEIMLAAPLRAPETVPIQEDPLNVVQQGGAITRSMKPKNLRKNGNEGKKKRQLRKRL